MYLEQIVLKSWKNYEIHWKRISYIYRLNKKIG